jgi:hypothetical protein
MLVSAVWDGWSAAGWSRRTLPQRPRPAPSASYTGSASRNDSGKTTRSYSCGSRLTSAMSIECDTGNAGGMARFLTYRRQKGAKSYNSYSFSAAWFVNRSVESENVKDATQAVLAAFWRHLSSHGSPARSFERRDQDPGARLPSPLRKERCKRWARRASLSRNNCDHSERFAREPFQKSRSLRIHRDPRPNRERKLGVRVAESLEVGPANLGRVAPRPSIGHSPDRRTSSVLAPPL